MIFVLTIINNVNNICKNENHLSLLVITLYSLLGIYRVSQKNGNRTFACYGGFMKE